MPVAAVSKLLYIARQAFDPGRSVTYEAVFQATLAHSHYVVQGLSESMVNTYINECRTYLMQRGVRPGHGIAVDTDGTYILTFFGG